MSNSIFPSGPFPTTCTVATVLHGVPHTHVWQERRLKAKNSMAVQSEQTGFNTCGSWYWEQRVRVCGCGAMQVKRGFANSEWCDVQAEVIP